MTQTCETILSALKNLRAPVVPSEYDLHAMIAQCLAEANIPVEHEVKIAPRCRIDFAVGSIGIEVKKNRPTPAALQKQVARYLASDTLSAIIVVTQRAVDLPHTIHGKPVRLLSLNRLWGVALP